MPISRKLFVALLLATCAGCGNGDSGATPSLACAPPPPTVPAPTLPDGIPSPDRVAYTSVSQDQARLTAQGFAGGTIEGVAAAYRSAFAGHSLLTLGTAKDRGGQITMSVSGPSTQGTVTLDKGCDRTNVLLELRPLTGP